MVFVYKTWDAFCRSLAEKGIHSIPACDVREAASPYLVLKHDVETDVARALRIARIEQAHGHRGSYYVQAYLLEDARNIPMLAEMQAMGHEITYHYDVMDSAKGDLSLAMEQFEKNRLLFEENGFPIVTVCQHGNPVVERVGYTSNRDFFRSEQVRITYPAISDIMVNYKDAFATDYTYVSDAGRRFQVIFDPINNDVVKSDDKNTPVEDTEGLLALALAGNTIISIHPHRWSASALAQNVKTAAFGLVRAVARLLVKIPFMKRLMSRYYHLAKKL